MGIEIPKTRELVLGENRERLSLKLQEYITRKGVDKYNQKKNNYKIEICRPLVQDGRINLDDIKDKLKAEEGQEFNDHDFEDAGLIIRDYVMTGGKNLYFSTGLPEMPQADLEEGEIK